MNVKVSYDDLEALHAQLASIIDEFENASQRRQDLVDDIGKPYGRTSLRDRAEDFEQRWDDRRSQLLDGCKGVRDHVEGVLEGFGDWDSETAAQMAEEMDG